MNKCPPQSQIEMFAVAGNAYPAVAEHVAKCAACRANVDEIIANQQFLGDAQPALATAFDARRDWSTITTTNALPPPGTVPGFELIEEISRGGQGIVYRAFHTETKRPAAVKMLLAGTFASGNQRRRFKREIEIAARFRHPSIVSVFDAGVTTDGRRYIAMEFVDGRPLDRFCRERWPLTPQPARDRTGQVLRLVRAVADGVGYAHTSGVLHRDLKPSNILVEADGTPRILDFGLARAAEGATVTSEFAGTPAYAAPEQFTTELGAVTTRTDVYALGLILYIALTETHPYPHAGTFAEMAGVVITTEPVPPTRVVPRLPADVETITLKALAKDPARRYPSASALAADIDDFLANRPISARRDSTVYVLRKLAFKHRLPALTAALILILILGAAIGFALLARDLDRTRRTMEAALSDSNVHRARLMAAAGDSHRAEKSLWSEAFRAGLRVDDSFLSTGSPGALRRAWSLAEYYARQPRLFRVHHDKKLLDVGVSPDGLTIWAFDQSGSRITWSREGQLLGATPPHQSLTAELEADISPNGRFAAIASDSQLSLFDLNTGTCIAGPVHWDTAAASVSDVADDGSLLVTASSATPDGVTRLFRTNPLEQIAEYPDPAARAFFAQAPDGLRLLISSRAGPDTRVIVRYGPEWAQSLNLSPPVAFQEAPANVLGNPRLSPDGRWVLTACRQNLVLFDTRSGPSARPHTTASNRAIVNRLRLNERGSLAAIGLEDGLIIIESIPDLVPVRLFHNGAGATGVAITADLVAAVDSVSNLSVYDFSDRPWLERVSTGPKTNQAIACASDGTIAWGNDAGILSIRSARPPYEILTFNAHASQITSVAFSPVGPEILSAGADKSLREWHRDGRLSRIIAAGVPDLWSARYSHDASAVAAGTRRGKVCVITGDEPPRYLNTGADRVPMVAFSPDSRTIVSAAAARGPAIVWSVATGAELFRVYPCDLPVRAVAFSPDGGFFVTGADDRTIRAWDAATGRALWTAEGLPWGVFDVKFHPDGAVLFAVGRGPEIVVLSAADGAEVATLRVHEGLIFSIDMTPDGKRLVTSGEDPWIGITDLSRLLSYVKGNESFWRGELSNGVSPAPRNP